MTSLDPFSRSGDFDMTRLPVVGDRFRLVNPIDRYPLFHVPAGATGTISEIDDTDGDVTIYGKIDQFIPGAEEWDNQIEWYTYEDFFGYDEFVSDVEFI